MRFDVRVCSHGSLWEIRPGVHGNYQFYPSREVALGRAHDIARRVWLDARMPSSVRLLQPDGVWVIDADYGEDPGSH